MLVVRVQPEILGGQKLPPELVTRHIWRERYQDICNVERHLSRNGVVVRKFFLHLSRAEQKKRFLERLTKPEKRFKFALGDVKEKADDAKDEIEERL